MPSRLSQRGNHACPFLVPVSANQLFIYPTSAFCRPPWGGLRIPADTTIEGVCTRGAHRACPGYLASMEEVAIDRMA